MSVNVGEHGGIIVHCHAGCEPENIVRAMGLSLSDLAGLPQCIARYPYVDENDVLRYTVERWTNPKTFRVVPGLPPASERVLYNMPAITWAKSHNEIVFVVEGEKDVKTLTDLQIPSTCNVGGAGAGKWLPQYTDTLAGLNVVVVADNDAPGKAHARYIAAELEGKATSVMCMFSPHGKDVTDLINAGYTIDKLQLLPEVEEAAIYKASSIRTREIQWAWKGQIALGKVSIIEGDPGDGKSVLTLDLAARWSTGTPMPDGTRTMGPCDVLLVSAEDDPEDTIVPRLRRAGADVDRVHMVTHGATESEPFTLDDLPSLMKFITTNKVKIIVFDPLSAFLPEKTDSHNDHSVRRALYPLKVLAAMTGAAVIVVRHLNKGTGKAIYRGSGSIGFVGAARACFLVAPNPENEVERILVCSKNNLARKTLALTYTIETAQDVPYVVWGNQLELTAQQVLDGPERQSNPDADDELVSRRKARESEQAFLWDILEGGPLPWHEIVQLGKADGFSERTLVRARADLGLVKLSDGGGNRGVRWARALATQGEGETPFIHSATPPESQVYSESQWPSGIVGGPPDESSHTESPSTDVPTLPLSHAVPSATGTQPEWPNGQVGPDPEAEGLYPDGTTEEQRDTQLDELPLICGVCKTTELVMRYYRPWWTIRCINHSPMTYGRGEL